MSTSEQGRKLEEAMKQPLDVRLLRAKEMIHSWFPDTHGWSKQYILKVLDDLEQALRKK